MILSKKNKFSIPSAAALAISVALTALTGCSPAGSVRINAVEAFRPQENNLPIDKILEKNNSAHTLEIDIKKLSMEKPFTGDNTYSEIDIWEASQYAIDLVKKYSYRELVQAFYAMDSSQQMTKIYTANPNELISRHLNHRDRLYRENLLMTPSDVWRIMSSSKSVSDPLKIKYSDKIREADSLSVFGVLKGRYKNNGYLPIGDIQTALTLYLGKDYTRAADSWGWTDYPKWYRKLFVAAVAYTILTRAAEDSRKFPMTEMVIVPSMDSDPAHRVRNTYATASKIAKNSAGFYGSNTSSCAIYKHASRRDLIAKLPTSFSFEKNLNKMIIKYNFLGKMGDVSKNLTPSISDAMFSDESRYVYDLIVDLPGNANLITLTLLKSRINCEMILTTMISNWNPVEGRWHSYGFSVTEYGTSALKRGEFKGVLPEEMEFASAYTGHLFDYVQDARSIY